MAKLKFNEMELQVTPNSQPNMDEKKQIEDLAKKLKPFMLPKINQNIKKLSHDVTDLNKMIINRENKFAEDLQFLKNKIKNVSNQDLKKEIENSEEFLMDRVVDCVNRIHKLEVQEKTEIVKPEVKQVTIHKNHEDEIKELHQRINSLPKIENHKVIEIKHVESKNQKYINIGLIVITTLSLLLHIL